MIEYSGPIIVIAGPTASGKSKIALKLAKDINGVIINADSKQVYKEISIGTARPTKEDMGDIVHFLYGHISVKDGYNIYQYQKDVQGVLINIPKEKIPILVGGTGLYIDSVVFNYKLRELNIDSKERMKLSSMSKEELKSKISQKLLSDLNESDLENPMRLIRIIEKEGDNRSAKGDILNHRYFVIDIPRDVLLKKIEERVEKMFINRLLEENIEIREEGLNEYPALKTIGYQEFDGYFKKEKTLKEVKDEIIKHTNQYAKRQKTWFRKHKHAVWSNDYDLILDESLKFINI